MRGRSHSPHHHYHHSRSRHDSSSSDRPHIPPKEEEEKQVLVAELLKRSREESLRKQAVQEFKLKQIEEEESRKRIVEEARLRDREKEENRKVELATQKEKWEAEKLGKEKKEEEAKKKKDKEIEAAVRACMVKAGYHNHDIEAAVERKAVHYCQQHHQPHPCGICVSSTTITSSVLPKHSFYRIRRDRICTKTLRYFGLLYEYDPEDENFVRILSDKSRWDEEELLRHSRKHFSYDYSREVWVTRSWCKGKRERRSESVLRFLAS